MTTDDRVIEAMIALDRIAGGETAQPLVTAETVAEEPAALGLGEIAADCRHLANLRSRDGVDGLGDDRQALAKRLAERRQRHGPAHSHLAIRYSSHRPDFAFAPRSHPPLGTL